MPYDKATVRSRFLNSRRARSAADREATATGFAREVLRLPEAATAATAAVYLAVGTEPPTGALVEALWSRNVTVLAPVLLPDNDLDWAVHTSPDNVVTGRHGLPQPGGRLLGRTAIAAADLVVVPALAVAPGGVRLGRGGGSYDRALARVPAGTAVVALVFPEELVPDLPADAHDRPVTVAVTPTGAVRW